jgi:dihydropteroate synthase
MNLDLNSAKIHPSSQIPTLQLRGNIITFEETQVMGIVNINSDSFFAGSRATETDAILKLTEKHITEGATFIDIGASSSKPGSTISNAEYEWKTLESIIPDLLQAFPNAYFSIDTYHALVAKNAIEMGIDIVNDISAGSIDNTMFDTIAALNAPYVLMHMQGNPQNMQTAPHYEDVTKDVLLFFSKQIQTLRQKGVTNIIVDPGFGFGKTQAHNYQLFDALPLFKNLHAPILVGISRKSMITKVLNVDAANALNGTTVLNTLAILNGANILRVHDVQQAKEAIHLLTFAKNNTN